MPGLQALNWMDPEWRIRVTVPSEGNEGALGRDLHHHLAPDVTEAVARADRSGRPTRTHALVELLQGGSGFGTYWPVTGPRGRRVGFVNAVFRTDQLIAISGVAHHLEDRFRLALLEDEGVAFGAGFDGGAWPLAARRRIPVLDREWTLVVAPSPARLALLETGTGWAAIELVGGWGACALIGWLLYGLLSRRTALASSSAPWSRPTTRSSCSTRTGSCAGPTPPWRG